MYNINYNWFQRFWYQFQFLTTRMIESNPEQVIAEHKDIASSKTL